MSTCHIAGIVKGIAERNDPTWHFGSLIGYGHHVHGAISAGLISAPDDIFMAKLTDLGLKYYKEKNLSALPNTRSYFWTKPDSYWSSDGEK